MLMALTLPEFVPDIHKVTTTHPHTALCKSRAAKDPEEVKDCGWGDKGKPVF